MNLLNVNHLRFNKTTAASRRQSTSRIFAEFYRNVRGVRKLLFSLFDESAGQTQDFLFFVFIPLKHLQSYSRVLMLMVAYSAWSETNAPNKSQ